MKKLILGAMLLTQAALADIEYQDDTHVIDWSKKGTLQHTYLQMCDDSFAPNLRLFVPGRLGQEFTMKVDYEKCSIKTKPAKLSGGTATQFIIEGGCVGTIEVIRKGSTQKAVIDMHDAC